MKLVKTSGFTVVLICMTALTLSACGKGASENLTSTTPSATPSPSVTSTGLPNQETETVDNDRWGIVTGPEIIDAYGSYNQVRIDDNSPLLAYDTDVVVPGVADVYTNEQITVAQKMAVNFYVSEGVDSILTFDANQTAKDAWLVANSDKVDPSIQADLFATIDAASLEQAYQIVEGNYGDWRHEAPYSINPAAYETDTPRVYFRHVTLENVSLSEDRDLKFDYTASYVRSVVVDEADRWETVEAQQSYTVRQQDDGTWKLIGWSGTSTTDWI